jgi:hypothetical protein
MNINTKKTNKNIPNNNNKNNTTLHFSQEFNINNTNINNGSTTHKTDRSSGTLRIKRENYFLSTPRYILVASFVQLFIIVFATWYTGLNTMAPSQIKSSPGQHSGEDSSGGVHLHVTTDIIATLGLVIATVLFLVSGLLFKWTDPITIDHVVFILAVWIILGISFRYVCICCNVTNGTALEQHDRASNDTVANVPYSIDMGTAAPPDRLIVEWEGMVLFTFDSMCSQAALVAVTIHNSTFLGLIVIIYVAIYRDHHLFEFFKRNKSTTRWSLRPENLMRIVCVILYALGIFVPFECSNASLMNKEVFFWKVVLFSVVFMLRVTNTYNRKYFIDLSIQLYSMKIRKQQSSIDIYRPYYLRNTKDVHHSNHPLYTPLSIVVNQHLLVKAKKTMEYGRVMDTLTDWVVASLVIFVCGWFTVAAVAQAIFEIVLLYKSTGQYNAIIYSFQHDFNKKSDDINAIFHV